MVAIVSCNHSKYCNYYRAHKIKTDCKKSSLLVESYCEGDLRDRCHRVLYREGLQKDPPDELSPNGYLIGSHKKIRAEDFRKHKRYKVKDSICLIQEIKSPKTFSAGIVDVSDGGVCLRFDTDLKEVDVDFESNRFQVISHSQGDSPLIIAKEIVKMVWRKGNIVGCSFADPCPAN